MTVRVGEDGDWPSTARWRGAGLLLRVTGEGRAGLVVVERGGVSVGVEVEGVLAELERRRPLMEREKVDGVEEDSPRESRWEEPVPQWTCCEVDALVGEEVSAVKELDVTRDVRGEGRLAESWEEMEMERLTSRELRRRMCRAEAIRSRRVKG